MTKTLVSICLLLTGVFILSGCVTSPPYHDKPDICRADCRVDINLPDEPADFHVEAGTQVNFRIQHGETDRGRTVLSFEEPAFENAQGTPLYTLELRGGNNLYDANDQGYCAPDPNDPDEGGCKYVVIDVSRPDEPSIISTPTVIVY